MNNADREQIGRNAAQIIANSIAAQDESKRQAEERRKAKEKATAEKVTELNGRLLKPDEFNDDRYLFRLQYGNYEQYLQITQLNYLGRIAEALEGIERQMGNP